MAIDITDYSNVTIVLVFLKIIKEKFSQNQPLFRFLNDEQIKDNLNTYLDKYVNHLQAVKKGKADLLSDNIPPLIKRGVLLLKLLNDQNAKSVISYPKFYGIPNFNFNIEYKDGRKRLILGELFLKNIYVETEVVLILKLFKLQLEKVSAIEKSTKLFSSEDSDDSEELILNNITTEEIDLEWDKLQSHDHGQSKENNETSNKGMTRSQGYDNLQTLEPQENKITYSNKNFPQEKFLQSVLKITKPHASKPINFNESLDSNQWLSLKMEISSVNPKPKKNARIIETNAKSNSSSLSTSDITTNNNINFGSQQCILLSKKHTTDNESNAKWSYNHIEDGENIPNNMNDSKQNKKKLSVLKEEEEFESINLNK